jgi:hypothetical protein
MFHRLRCRPVAGHEVIGAWATPLGNDMKTTKDGIIESDSKIVGLSILQASTMDEALEMLKDHHHLHWAEDCEIVVLNTRTESLLTTWIKCAELYAFHCSASEASFNCSNSGLEIASSSSSKIAIRLLACVQGQHGG